MRATHRFSIVAFTLLTSSVAFATPSRVNALSGNHGFTDDSDFMVYPTEVSPLGTSTWFHYDGGYTGAVTWDGNAVTAGVGPNGGWDMSWTNSHDTTGYGVRASYMPDQDNAMSIGGSWGNADRSDGLKNLALAGGLTYATVNEDPSIDFSFGATSRSLSDSDFSTWGAAMGYSMSEGDSSVGVGGQYFMGPRLGSGDSAAALSIGTMAGLNAALGDDSSTNLYVALPAANIASEYAFNDLLMVRGSVTTGVMVNHDGTDINTGAFVSGAAGMTLSGDKGHVDLTFNPDWALAGPYFLTGNPSPMLGMVTARFEM